MNPAFWQGRRVFLTGHTGFKGAWLSLWLQRLGAQVTGYALAPRTTPSLFALADVGAGMRSINADVRDLPALRAALIESRAEVVIHMAAQPIVRLSYYEPVETFSTNVMGTVHLLEAVREAPTVSAVVIVTSDKCYENVEREEGYREDEPMGGYDPYSSSKGCAELVTAAYRRSFFSEANAPAVGSARAGNVIGGGDWALDRLVPDILAAMERGEAPAIRAPESVRPWQHVLEPLSGYLTLAEQLHGHGAKYAEPWNFAPDESDARPVRWIVERLSHHWGMPTSGRLDTGEQPYESTYLKLDATKARERLAWRPSLTIDDTLQWIVEWHRAYLRGSARAATLEQLDRYQSLLQSRP